MSSRPFRFVHASDFHLERPPAGLAEVPDHFRQVFVDAPYRAAQRVFDTALKEQVDLLLLAGDILDVRAGGPRGIAFLLENFERLEARGITVVWVGGKVDPPDRWPAAIVLPDNVHRFDSTQVDQFIHERDDEPLLVQILGLSAAATGGQTTKRKISTAGFHSDQPGLFALAVAYGQVDPAALSKQSIGYWALGGEHSRHTLPVSTGVAHYCGSPQGRRPRETGPHGCTLVHVDDTGHARTTFVPTDVVRWHHEKLTVREGATRGDVERLINDRAKAMSADAAGPDLLVHWTLQGSGSWNAELRRGKLGADMIGRLRNEYGQRRPAVWSIALDGEATDQLPEDMQQQEGLLGDYLRTVQQYEHSPTRSLDVHRFLDSDYEGRVASLLTMEDADARREVLREVALMGIELLSGEGPSA